MPADIKQILQRVLNEVEEEERNDLLLELKDRKLTGKELAEAIRNLPDNERAEVREAFISVVETQGGGPEKRVAKQMEDEAEKEEEASDVGVAPKEPEEKKGKTRRGRKNGRAYDWYVDDKGRVIVSDVATVYSGEDEPDEVEMWNDDEEEEEEEEA
jgi:hypothetical protein